MVRSETIGGATVYLGDARDIVSQLPDCLHCMVSDPPYLLTSGGDTNHPNAMSGGWMKDFKNTGEIVDCEITWHEIMEIAREAVPQGDIYIMANDKNVPKAFEAAFDVGLRHHNLLVWDKRACTANRWYMKNVEFVLYLFAGKARTINAPGSKQLISFPQKDETKHPTEKPVELMRHYIENSTVPGELVFDPFMGTGTTGVAALRSGRRFVGIELNQRWFDVACQRLESAMQGTGELFVA